MGVDEKISGKGHVYLTLDYDLAEANGEERVLISFGSKAWFMNKAFIL